LKSDKLEIWKYGSSQEVSLFIVELSSPIVPPEVKKSDLEILFRSQFGSYLKAKIE